MGGIKTVLFKRKRVITSKESFILITLLVFVGGIITEVINFFSGNRYWIYHPFGEAGNVVFGTVTTGVFVGWFVLALLCAIFVTILAQRVNWR